MRFRLRTAHCAVLLLSASAMARAAGPLAISGEGLVKISAEAGKYDLGTIDLLAAGKLERVFKVSNTGSRKVVIDRVQPSCGCTSILLGAEDPTKKYTLDPGKDVAVRFTLDVSHFKSGPIDKFVWIFADGSSMPAITVELTGTVCAPVSFIPAAVNFGRVRARSAQAVTISLTLDSRLTKDGKWPDLTSSNPDIRITPLPGSISATDGKTATRSYQLTLAPEARLGVLTGFLAVVPKDTAIPASVVVATTAPIVGQVDGRLQASPGSIVFGAVTQGQKVTREVQFAADTADALKELRITSQPPYVVGTVKPGQTGQRVAIEFTLAPNVPAGAHEIQVTVTSHDGERLVLPVILYVSPK